MGWLYLMGAIFFELCGTLSMKEAHGFTRLWPSVGVFFFYALCMSALTLAMNTIDLGIAYAIWSGLGTAVMATVGILYYHEPVSLGKVVSLVMIIAGVAGLKLAS